MKFTLKSFDDLGKCSMATLLDEFDTEHNHIYVKKDEHLDRFFSMDSYDEIKIESASDLFDYLWSTPAISSRDNGEHSWMFIGKNTWWQSYYNSIIASANDILDKEYGKLKRGRKTQSKKSEDLIKEAKERIEYSEKRIAELNSSMEAIKQKILKDNEQ